MYLEIRRNEVYLFDDTVKSNPTRTDSDEDGIPDSEDKKPKKADYQKIDDKLLDDSKIFDSKRYSIVLV